MCPGPQTRCCPQPCSPSGRAVGQWLVDEVREEFSLQRINPALTFSGSARLRNSSIFPCSLGKGRRFCGGHSLLSTAWFCLKCPCASSASLAPGEPCPAQGVPALRSRLGAALPPTRWCHDPDNGFLAPSCRDTLGYRDLFVRIINSLPPTCRAPNLHLTEKNPTMVKRKMRENTGRVVYFRLPIKDNVTNKSSSAVITLMPKALQMCSKRLMLAKAGPLPGISPLPILI